MNGPKAVESGEVPAWTNVFKTFEPLQHQFNFNTVKAMKDRLETNIQLDQIMLRLDQQMKAPETQLLRTIVQSESRAILSKLGPLCVDTASGLFSGFKGMVAVAELVSNGVAAGKPTPKTPVGEESGVSSAKPKSTATPFTGYLGSLTETSPEDAGPAVVAAVPTSVEAAKVTDLSTHTVSELHSVFKGMVAAASELHSVFDAMLAATEVASDAAPALDTHKLRTGDSSAKPPTTSTPFAGYIGSLAKQSDTASSELGTPKLRKDKWSPKPRVTPTPFGGYVGSLNEQSS
jgi:hypothetical protein